MTRLEHAADSNQPGTTRDALAGLIPVSIITGFLGSGKTTLVNRLLKRPEMNRVAVIVNELGEIGIDNDLVEVSSEQMMLLNNGCLCCVLRGDLQETLRDLFIKRRNGEIIDFDRVVIETTGLADPAPVMQTLITDTLLLEQYRLDCVVTLVDAVNAPGQLVQFTEPVKQVALADRLVVTKSDLVTEKQLAALDRAAARAQPEGAGQGRVERRDRAGVPGGRRLAARQRPAGGSRALARRGRGRRARPRAPARRNGADLRAALRAAAAMGSRSRNASKC